jgi:hypothetical protein
MAHQLRTLVPLVQLPDGSRIENANTVVTISDTDWARIPASAIGVDITDLGAVIAGDAVTAQAAFVAQASALTSAQASALTSSQNATAAANTQTSSYVQVDAQTIATLANALKTSYNAAQVDIAALRTAYNALQVDVAALRTKLNAELTALQVTGGPQAAS